MSARWILCCRPAIVLFVGFVHAQDRRDLYNFSDVEPDPTPPNMSWIGGGYVGNVVFADLDGFNQLATNAGIPTLNGPVYLDGGGGTIPFPLHDRLMVGVSGFKGRRRVSTKADIGSAAVVRSIELRASMIGPGSTTC